MSQVIEIGTIYKEYYTGWKKYYEKKHKDKIINIGEYLRKKVDKKDDGELSAIVEIDDENMYDMYALLDYFFEQQHANIKKMI